MRKGFTLVELLITITVISIISAIGFTSYSNAQITTRDGRRKNDLRSIATALELYKQKNGRYPCPPSASGWNFSSSTAGTLWIDDSAFASCSSDTAAKKLDTNYINQVPNDPLKNSGLNPTTGSNKGYGYGYITSLVGGAGSCPATIAGNYYVLATTLENSKDADVDNTKRYLYCDGTTHVFGDPSTKNANGYAIISP